ncbi:hypothetical protein C8R45DRAFT_1099015 [Mycena sanguinolenta]|nr:hypothetical protein C8R45DRAFT_1099015 [Mycena sanguinolenta]
MSAHLVAQAFDVVLDNAPTVFQLAGGALCLLPAPGHAVVVKGPARSVDAVKASGGARMNEGTRRAFLDEVIAFSNRLWNMLRGAAVLDAGSDEDALIQEKNKLGSYVYRRGRRPVLRTYARRGLWLLLAAG